MAGPSIAELKAYFRISEPRGGGDYGEILAERILITKEIHYARVDQRPETLGEALSIVRGKRPDFFARLEDKGTILILDAKFHLSENLTSFALRDDELKQYRRLIAFMSRRLHSFKFQFFFLVFPKEHKGAKCVWIPLSAFNKGGPCLLDDKPAKRISLLGRERDWTLCKDLAPLPQPDFLKSDVLRACCDLVTRKL